MSSSTDQLGFAHDPTVELQSAGATKGEIFAIERVVVAASPFFATAAAVASAWVADNVPGVKFSPTDICALMVAIVFLVAATVIKWLHGRQNPAFIGGKQALVAGVAGSSPAASQTGGGGGGLAPAQLAAAGGFTLPPIPAGMDPAPAPAPAPGAVVGQA